MNLFTLKNAGWFMGYVLAMAVVAGSLNRYRSQAITTYGTPEATEKWQKWRDAAEEMGRQGSVDRDQPASMEPPSLVLMRDHFPACVGISMLLSSCLYLWFMVCVRGALRPVTLVEHDDDHH